MDWQDSPISTSISTKPLEGLEFPGVTICPKEGANTALNRDLIRAHNMTLTEESQKDLQKAAYEIFISSTYQRYINKMMDVVGNDGIKDILDGFSAIPKTFDKGGYLLRAVRRLTLR